jgi:hypothetical protein
MQKIFPLISKNDVLSKATSLYWIAKNYQGDKIKFILKFDLKYQTINENIEHFIYSNPAGDMPKYVAIRRGIQWPCDVWH